MTFSRPAIRLASILIALLVASPSLLADKGGEHGHGHGHGKKHDRDDYRGDDRYESRRGDDRYEDRRGDHSNISIDLYFNDSHRHVINDYYGREFRAGHCPPGLAKKNNGCMPPGQARQWQKGRPLPRSVVVYELPHSLMLRLPPPPHGHRYVRVASDILLIAVGTSMVADAIMDITNY